MLLQDDGLRGDPGDPGERRGQVSIGGRRRNKKSCKKSVVKQAPATRPLRRILFLLYTPFTPFTPFPRFHRCYLVTSSSPPHCDDPSPAAPYAVPSPLSYSMEFFGERKSSSMVFQVIHLHVPGLVRAQTALLLHRNNMPRDRHQVRWPGGGWGVGERGGGGGGREGREGGRAKQKQSQWLNKGSGCAETGLDIPGF